VKNRLFGMNSILSGFVLLENWKKGIGLFHSACQKHLPTGSMQRILKSKI